MGNSDNACAGRLREIADMARLLYSSYQEVAVRYRNHREMLRDARNTPGCEWEIENLLHGYRSYRDVCSEYDGMLSQLALLVPTHLPNLWPQLRLVAFAARWYENDNFDWDRGIEELRKIEAAALHGAGASRTEDAEAPADLPAKKKAGRRKGQQPRCNDQMRIELEKIPEAAGWSLRDWSDHLDFSESTIQGTQMWEKLRAAHKLAEVERREEQDRRRGLDRKGIDKRSRRKGSDGGSSID